ncbi:acyltransferase [Shewanella sp. 202IG2-18]|uniref:acyltransferase n=1 Tax=Parashewanella hymeniacidonis TaxID=2807618 RepID=UPI00195F5ECD|nr:acyltransferase [Parashewanella hymeniacidonis]MBM7072353.1 acyltransferase [Parashewanella hymeniacidonis]
MLSFLPAPLLFIISAILLVINTCLWAGLISIGGIIKALLPVNALKIQLTKVMNAFMYAWASCNGLTLKLTSNVEWQIEGLENVHKDSWYLIFSNHLSGFDIAAQSFVLRNHAPMLKFFLKKELLYVPFIGLGCWALDMPFMNRTSPKKLKKNPKLRGKDLESTRKACQKFKHLPTSIMNYAEGSRFTEEKRQRQNSPYKHLLRPKAGGIAFALSAMGDQFSSVLNMTLVYPDNPENVLMDAMCGRLKRIIVKVDALPVPQVDADEYSTNSEYRVEFQRWLNDIWQEKDKDIEEFKQQ